MKNILYSLIFVASGSLFGQTHQAYYQQIVDQTDHDLVTENLQIYVAFGVKRDGTTAHENAKNWIVSQYQNFGYEDIVLQDFILNGQVTHNIVVTKLGTKYPDKYIIVDGHYDSINGPGANDNGSGTMTLLEIARLLKDVETEYSIKFIHFTAEEIGLIGSQNYVSNVAIPQNLDIELVLNIDEVGGVKGKNNNTIVCERDESSPSINNQASNNYTNQMATIFGLYTDLQTKIAHAYSSDYMPFQSAGYVITGLFEGNESPYPHSPSDTIENMDLDYLNNVIKGALASVLHFAVAKNNLSLDENTVKNATIYPNPVKNHFKTTLDFTAYELYSSEGKLVQSSNQYQSTISLESIPKGIYLVKFKTPKGDIVKSIIKE